MGQGTQDLMTNFLNAEFIQRLEKLWEGEPPGEPSPFSRSADLPTSRFAEKLARQ